MAVMGIRNIDAFTRQVYLMEKACGEKVLQEAMEAAGKVLERALVAATPIGTQAHRTYKRKGEYRPAGTARVSVINVPARSKKYGIARRLIGYSRDAYYMFWVLTGHDMVTGGRKARRASAVTGRHSQGGKGVVVGHVAGRDIMTPVFRSNIKTALNAAIEVLRSAATGKAA